jgi:hypothetical protein
MTDTDSAVRYWGVLGVLMRGKEGVEGARAELRAALKDPSADVCITAAQALGQFGNDADVKEVLPLLADRAEWKNRGVFSALAALNSLDALGAKPRRSRQSSELCPPTARRRMPATTPMCPAWSRTWAGNSSDPCPLCSSFLELFPSRSQVWRCSRPA